MRISRIYLPIEQNQIHESIIIEGEKAHYIRNVLRIKTNHLLHFFIPAGVEYSARISAINKHDVVIDDIKKLTDQPPKCQIHTTLIQGISSSDRMDYSIQKAAELGCARLIPVLTEFCSQKVPAHKQHKKQQHWQAVAISASEQSGRIDVMEVDPIQQISEVIEVTDKAIYLEPLAATYINQLPAQYQQQQSVIIGPEGGFSPAEIELFSARGYLGVRLGYRVLRTETVAPVIMSALHTLYGDFKPLAE
ncbi:MAG: 16S rRNA (uracil(1498)-N(3))-methyltransferase [Marinicella sp.]